MIGLAQKIAQAWKAAGAPLSAAPAGAPLSAAPAGASTLGKATSVVGDAGNVTSVAGAIGSGISKAHSLAPSLAKAVPAAQKAAPIAIKALPALKGVAAVGQSVGRVAGPLGAGATVLDAADALANPAQNRQWMDSTANKGFIRRAWLGFSHPGQSLVGTGRIIGDIAQAKADSQRAQEAMRQMDMRNSPAMKDVSEQGARVLGKSGEYAPGISEKGQLGHPTKVLTKGQLVSYVLQHHQTMRNPTRPHFDLRLGNPELGMYSWAIPKATMPEPGEKRLAPQTEVHCLLPSTLIATENGAVSIKELVESKAAVRVWCRSDSGDLTLRQIRQWWKRANTEAIVRIQLSKTGQLRGREFWCTAGHQIITQRGPVSAADLTLDDLVMTRLPGLSDIQQQIVTGTLLGAGFITSKSCGLVFSHCPQQRSYAEYKASMLRPIITGVKSRGAGTVCRAPTGKILAAESVRSTGCSKHPEIIALSDSWYSVSSGVRTKMLPNDIRLTALSLAIWYQDNGSVMTQHGRLLGASIATHNFTGIEVDRLITVLRRDTGLIAFKVTRGLAKDGHIKWELRMSVAEARKLFAMIAPYVHPSMRYKITACDGSVGRCVACSSEFGVARCGLEPDGAVVAALPAFAPQNVVCETKLLPLQVRRVQRLSPKTGRAVGKFVYNLGVEEFHNYVLSDSGALVGNSFAYNDFQGNIGKGYGAGQVSTADKGHALITKVSPNSIHFTLAHTKVPVRYSLVKIDTPKGRDWLLVGQPTGRKEDVPGVGDKLQMHKIEAADVDEAISQAKDVQAKIDGASQVIDVDPHGRLEAYSVRKSVSGEPIVRTEHMGLGGIRLPKSLGDTTFRAEGYGVDKGGKPLPFQETSGLMNSGLARSIQTQQAAGTKMRVAPFQLLRYKGKPVEDLPPGRERDILSQLMQHLPKGSAELPEQATTPEAGKELLQRISSGEHPQTGEGIVIRGSKGYQKHVLRPEITAYLRGTYPGEGKRQGTAGGLMASLEPKGDPNIRLGTGFTDAQLQDIVANMPEHMGKPIKVEHRGQFGSGLLRAPAYKGMETDKSTEMEGVIS